MVTKSNPRRDLNQSAFAIMQQAIGEVLPEAVVEKKKAAQEPRRPSGVKGGVARAAKLTPEQRIDIARGAANARWGKTP